MDVMEGSLRQKGVYGRDGRQFKTVRRVSMGVMEGSLRQKGVYGRDGRQFKTEGCLWT